ncbi:MAG: MTH938/NDUFAF3 family protein [Phycisphaerae bacterium]
MHARLIAFGRLEINGDTYEKDVIIEAGRIRKRKKKPSKRYRDRFDHTPLTAEEDLPLAGDRLIIGTGADGALPIMDSVYNAAAARGIDVEAMPTADACRLLEELPDEAVHAVLHVTC